jgi:C1A family cysteine protease
MIKNIFLILLLGFGSVDSFFNYKKPLINRWFLKANYEYGKDYYDFLIKYNKIDLNEDKGFLLSGSSFYDNIIESRKDNYEIFANNLENINEFNKNSEFKLGLNQFADTFDFRDENEYSNSLMAEKLQKNNFLKNNFLKNDVKTIIEMIKNPDAYIHKYNNLKDEIIWDEENILSEVKDQKNCGSCWAFSSTSAIEAKMRLKNYNVTRLSEQELVDCSDKNHGCNGGLMDYAFDYVIKNGGLTTNELYPYNASESECKICINGTSNNFDKVYGSNFTEYKYTIPRSKLDLMASLKEGPVSIALDASNFAFRFYKEGIINIPANYSKTINHAVLLTGYSKDENGTYWIIQNSWGRTWGDNGYAKLRAIDGDGVLLCQIYGVYPLI